MNNEFDGAKVLVVEDEADLNAAYCKVLSEAGFVVECVKDGSQALEKIKDFKPDLILLDLRMPVMGGVEFLTQADVKGSMPNTQIIVFTNFDLNDEIAQAFELGANRYVLKAMVSPNQLVKLVKDELSIGAASNS